MTTLQELKERCRKEGGYFLLTNREDADCAEGLRWVNPSVSGRGKAVEIHHFEDRPVDPRTETFVEAAYENQVDGEYEVDGRPLVSGSDDNGDYVFGWIWVSNSQAGFPDKYEDEDEDDGLKDYVLTDDTDVYGKEETP